MSLPDADLASDQLIGKVIDERFEILELIGRGANGLVYKARQRLMNRLVAIKVLHRHLLERQNQDRFRQELRAIGTLSHPNILSLYSAGTLESGQPYMVLEYLEGQTLADAIKAGLRWPDRRCLLWLKQVLAALEYAHVNGVIHRDLKPTNVVLTAADDLSKSVRLVDFGIARLINLSSEEKQRLTQTGAVFGTPLYMSPEQCAGKPTDPRSDIYAFGCLMFETLTGSAPFDGGSAYDIMCRHLHDEPAPMNSASSANAVPVALEAIVRRCLAKEPIKRFQSAVEVLQAIELYENDPDAGKQMPSKRPDQAGSRAAGRGKFSFSKALLWFVGSAVSLVLLRSLVIQGVDNYVIGSLVQEAKADAEQDKLQAASEKLKSAEVWLDRLSTIADVSSGSIVGGWRKLAFSYMKAGDTRAEATTLSHIVELEKQELGASSPVVVTDLTKLAETYLRAGEAASARNTLEQAILLSEDGGGMDKQIVPLYERVLLALREQGRHDEGEQGLKFILSRSNRAGIVDSHKAQLIQRLAETLYLQQRYEEALTHFLEAKVLKDRFDDVGNPEHIYNSYYAGICAQRLKKHSQAEVLLKHALAMQVDSTVFVKELPDVYCQIGYALTRQQRYKEAESYLLKASELLAVEQKMHPFTKAVCSAQNELALGEVLVKTGRAAAGNLLLTKAAQSGLSGPFEFIPAEAKALLNEKEKTLPGV